MNKWLALAAAALLLLWGPFLYRELGREDAGGASEDDDPGVGGDLLDDDVPKPVAALPPPKAATEPVAPEPPSVLPPAPAERIAPTEEVAPAEQAPPGEAEPPVGDEAAEVDEEDSEEEAHAPVRVPAASGPVGVLKGAFEQETRDALWASAQERTLHDLSEQHGFSAETLRVDCRRTVCRMDLQVDREPNRKLMELYLQLGRDVNNTLALEPEVMGDDSTRVFLYVPRSGYELSDFE